MKTFNSFVILSCLFLTTQAQVGKPPIKAPFDGIDVYCINDWWNHSKSIKDNPNKIINVDVPRDQVICFGIL